VLSFARVYVGTHYPGDVMAGALIGIAVVSALYFVKPARGRIEAVGQRSGAIWERLISRLARAAPA
jgi:membrane-associated phospholipid phosphatase